MTRNKIDLGPTGVTVAENIAHWREERRIDFAELSRRLAALGRVIPPLGLRRIENQERRVDTGDLAALALALNVSPLALLLPAPPTATGQIVPKGDQLAAERIWAWGLGQDSLSGDRLTFLRDSNPFLRIEGQLTGHGVLSGTAIPLAQEKEDDADGDR